MENANVKNANVKKINTIGKVSRILVTIFNACIIVGIVALVIGICALAAIPSDAVKINGTASASITIDDASIPHKLISFEEKEVSEEFLGAALKLSSKNGGVNGDLQTFLFDASAEDVDTGHIKLMAISGCAVGIVLLACLIVILCFAKKLARALENCQSPFEDAVLDAMKKFGWSLVPFAVIKILTTGFSLFSTAIPVLVVLAFIYIFKYGAELQQQSDETL